MRWLVVLILVGLVLSFVEGPAAAQNVDPTDPLGAMQRQKQVPGQQPVPVQESAALRGLVLALQQIGVSSEQYVNDVKAQLAAKDARIAELIKLCGEPCKPMAEAK